MTMKVIMKRKLKFRLWDKISNTMHHDVLPFGAFWNTILASGGDWMEFTGLTDRNGKEIFESDILKNNNDTTFEICFGKYQGYCQQHLEYGWFVKNKFELYGAFDCAGSIEEMEVIGNIYQTPELIEKGE